MMILSKAKGIDMYIINKKNDDDLLYLVRR